MRRLVAALACVGVLAAFPAEAADYVRNAPMQFSLWREGPADACGEQCRTWVSATGAIRPESARDFEAFAQKNDLQGKTIAFESEGGSVLGALALGRAIHRFGMTTTVGKTLALVGDDANDPRGRLSPRADCESMCGFLLLAGAKRVVPPEARVRVHQIWLGDRREDATAASYTAEDLVLVQRDIGKIAQYTVDMGGSIELLSIALRIPPWEPMRLLTRDELKRMNIDMPDDAAPAVSVSAPAAPAPASVVAAPLRTTGGRTGGIGDRGWTLGDQSGRPSLSRQHPLTAEGDDIGSFDLVFACGETDGDFQVTYSERRRGNETRLPESLKDVSISVRGQPLPLKVIATDLKPKRAERISVASAKVPADMLKQLAEPGPRSILISARNADSPVVIRVGNTGIAQNFPRLAAACAKPSARARAADQAGLINRD